MKYRTLQVSLQGDAYIFDYRSDNKSDLWEAVNNQGSKWIFYPLPFIVKNEYGMDFKHKRIIEACDGLQCLEGMTISKALDFIKKRQDFISEWVI